MPSSDTWFRKGRGDGRPFVKGKKLPMKEVLCTKGCGTMLMRFNHLSDAICKPCQRKRETKQHVATVARQRLEARRYRILMFSSPYRSYEELLEALKVRDPRTRSERRDLNSERRNSA